MNSTLVLLFVFLLSLLSVNVALSLNFYTYRRKVDHCRSTISRIRLSSYDDDLSNLVIDESKLSKEEKERLAFIQKITLEADEMIRAAGFKIDSDDNKDDDKDIYREVKDTNWSGQSDAEQVKTSTRNYSDLIGRPGLAIVDLIALLTFSFIGRSSHTEGVDIINTIGTATPFIISWFALSPYLSAYSRDATKTRNGVFVGILPAWICSIPAAIGIRGLIKGSIPPTPFIIVSLISTFVLISLCRYVFISAVGSTSDKEYKDAGFLEVFKMVGTLMRRW